MHWLILSRKAAFADVSEKPVTRNLNSKVENTPRHYIFANRVTSV
jgi:hypothetical protein